MAKLYTFETIPFRLYLEIAESGNYYDLIISGQCDEETLKDNWEKIVKENSRRSGTFSYDRYLDKYRHYSELLINYTKIRAQLMALYVSVDLEIIADLKENRYSISTESAGAYNRTWTAAWRKVNNLVTKIKMSENQLAEMAKGGSNASFGEIIANLKVQLAPTVISNDITLAEYIELSKLARRKNEKRG